MFFYGINRRMKIVLFFITVIFLIIIFKVFYIEVFSYNKLNKEANNLWNRNLPIGSDRGNIYDRNGKLIAGNNTTTSLVFIHNQIKNKEKTAKSIAQILDVSYEKILNHINKNVSIERVHPEGRNIPYKKAEKIKNLNMDGVYLLKESKRYYPYKSLLSHTIGYVGIDNQGLSGLELYYNKYLTGKNGSIKHFSDGKGNKLDLEEIYEAPVSGMNLQLTIDLDIQKTVEKELDNIMKMYSPEDAIVIAADPASGEILSIANRPTFDSNKYQKYDNETINRNLAIWKTYEPGSTFKITTLSAALEENVVNLFEDKFYDSGVVRVENARIKCWKKGGHGAETFLNVVENSCNPGFVELGKRLGRDNLYSYVKKFGFGTKTGIDLNGEAVGILFKKDAMGPVETATTSFGQGISVTPIQQLMAVSAAINGGYLLKPYIVKTISEPETNEIIYKNKKKVVRKVISKKTSNMVRYALESVVANGTGHNAYIENYRVGGKTGTAQKVESGRYLAGNYIVSFIGFMPADNPKIILYVAINNPKGITQYGGTVSAPIAKHILSESISNLKIKPDLEGMERSYQWYEQKYTKLPDVKGLNIKDIRKLLKDYKLEYSGDGDTCIYTMPEAGYYIKEGGTVKIMLN